MSDKPIKCGCGGEVGQIRTLILHWIRCRACGIEIAKDTEAEAVAAWNRAMGAGLREAAREAVDTLRYNDWHCIDDLEDALKEVDA